jgi:hypothetical protein
VEVLLSAACIKIYEGDSTLHSTAMALDYFSHGLSIVQRAKQVAKVAINAIGPQLPGDYNE